jgi:hypothetical protein
MWSFKRWRMRKKLRSAFSHYLANEVIDEIVYSPPGTRGAPQPTALCFILLQVRDDPVDQAPAHLAKAFDIIQRRDGMVWGVMSSMAIATFGLPFSDDPERDLDQRAKTIARLTAELGDSVRLIYGTVDGLLGNYGSEHRFVYGPLLPGFERHVSALTALKFGQAVEIDGQPRTAAGSARTQ